MASSGVSGVSWGAVVFVQNALLQEYSEQEAGAYFARMIQDSLKSWSTQVSVIPSCTVVTGELF